jgi:transposase
MKHYAGLDVSVKETAICVVDEDGHICREMKVPSHPDDLAMAVQGIGVRVERIGLEAGPLFTVAFRGAGSGRLSGDLHRDKAHEGLSQSAGEQDRPQ